MEGFSHFESGSRGGSASNSKASFLYQLPSSSTTSAPPHLHSYLATNSSSCSLPYHHLQGYNNSKPHEFDYYQNKVQAQRQDGIHGQDDTKLKIMSHPQYSSLISAYMDCQKVGAPPEVVDRLSAVAKELDAGSKCRRDEISPDPELDQFMEAYCDMLVKYREELMRPLQEATEYLKRVELQFNALTNTSPQLFTADKLADWKCEGGSSEEEQDASGAEAEAPEFDPRAEDKDLKHQLLKKYSGHLSGLRQELSKKKKKGKLPKEARQKLLNWWELHYKWPYPSENEKMYLAETTGLDQKQINNWFINQRKRHWKPSEDMQFMVMDGFHQPTAAGLFGEGNGMYRFGP